MFSVPKIEKVEDVMSINFVTVYSEDNLNQALRTMLKHNTISMLVKDKNEDYIGIISLRDIQNSEKLNKDRTTTFVKDIMSYQMITVDVGVELNECRDIMVEKGISILPVVDKGIIKGIVSQNHIRDFYYLSREDYATTLEYVIGEIGEGISVIDDKGVVILWNKFMESRYNIKSEEIVGRKMSDFLEDTISERALRTRMSKSDIYYMYNEKEKKDLYGLVHANTIYYKEEFVGVVCTELDITEAQNLSVELEKTNERIKYLQDEVKFLSKGVFDNILGKSYRLEKVKNMAKQVAKTNSSIFIWGESGTGKEVFARAIHEYSERKGQFVPVNCSAIPSELFESEFFGYEAGAFTGASKKGKLGFFEIAKGGTIFLDEIADMPLSMQAKLLRVIQEREIRRVGGEDVIPIDVRIISATNKDLEAMVRDETFREDLYYRLNVVELQIPSLRDRKEDIGILLYSFLEEFTKENNKPFLKISKEAFRAMETYSWKGNIRELRNTIENIVVLSTESTIEYDDIPSYIRESVERKSEKKEEYPLDLNEAVKKLELTNIKKALEIANGNKAKAAKILNIPRTTLYYKLDLYDIK